MDSINIDGEQLGTALIAVKNYKDHDQALHFAMDDIAFIEALNIHPEAKQEAKNVVYKALRRAFNDNAAKIQ